MLIKKSIFFMGLLLGTIAVYAAEIKVTNNCKAIPTSLSVYVAGPMSRSDCSNNTDKKDIKFGETKSFKGLKANNCTYYLKGSYKLIDSNNQEYESQIKDVPVKLSKGMSEISVTISGSEFPCKASYN